MRRLSPLVFMLLLSHSILYAAAAPTQTRPNVIVILADDMGFSDLGCYGGEMATPNLDALAADGVRFTQFYNTARCCPTRASLLTGLYPHQAGMGHMTVDHGVDGYRGDLNNQCVTIAEVLRDSGYNTYAIGKWHISRSARPDGDNHNWPLQRGFEKYYGTIWGAASYFDPGICRGNTWYSRDNDPEYKSDNYYFTNALSDNAVKFLQQHKEESPDKPFFMYTAFTAAHWPLMALEKDIAKYKGRFDAGYDKLRHERLERLQKMGIVNPKWDLSPTVGDLEKVKNREWELRCMEVYAAQIDCMDQGIGRIVAELKKQGTYDNTLILFLQDNGGCAEEIGRGKREEPKGEFHPLRPDEITGGGHPKQTRDGKPIIAGEGVMPGGPDTYLSYGEKWANVSDTPFREYKHWVHEGGIATPLIAHWPNVIPKSANNTFVKEPAHLIDIMATCVDVAQTSYPAERNGHKIVPMQGVSLVPLLTAKEFKRSEPIFWEHEGNRAVREGKWKLVAKEDKPWELYDMDADRTEMHDLSQKDPDRVREMSAKWDAYAAKSNVLPLGAWRAEPGKTQKPVIELKQGQVLGEEEAPSVDNRALTITVEIKELHGDGVLVAHGGTVHGYVLYVKDHTIHFEVRRNSKLTSVASPAGGIVAGSVTIVAALEQDGSGRILVNNVEVAKQPSVGLLSKTPKDGLSAGSDSGAPVGDYEAPFEYPGKLGKVLLQIAPANSSDHN